MKKWTFCVPVCLALGACSMLSPFRHEPAAAKQQPPPFDETSEAFLIFGLADAHARVQLQAGEIVDDERYRADWTTLTPIFDGGANKGFVVVKVPADRPIAITSISMENPWKEFWAGGSFNTCKGQKVVVFQVPKGKVLYYSNFDFRSEGRSLLFSASNDFAGAQEYVKNYYPQLSGHLQSAEFNSLTRADDCQKMPPKRQDIDPPATTAAR